MSGPKSSSLNLADTTSSQENTPLLGNGKSQDRRLSEASVAALQNGYLAITSIDPEQPVEPPQQSVRAIFAVLSVLLVGIFISQADGTLLLATIGSISSEFNDLETSGWLITSFGLAQCVTQPLYGKLSDIFGRKAVLQVAYLLFAVGGVISGLGQSMAQVIIGRVIQGSGGAGMVVLVSVLITDLVPLREVASYRSYVNIVQTLGRSCGGPIGGALAQTIGWRWAFILQGPLTVIAMVLVAWKLELKPKPDANVENTESQTMKEKLKRIDFLGALFMSTTILAAMLVFDLGGVKVPWTSPLIAGISVIAFTSGILFYVTEKYWTEEPIFPLAVLSNKHVVLAYLLLTVQVVSQISLIMYIPLYFEVTSNASLVAGGAYMVPTVMGNTVGGLVTGFYVKRTGRYKLPVIISSLSSLLCFTLLLLTWRGHTPVWQAFFVFFGGFGTGIAQSAVFVELAASVDESVIAIASAGLYLSTNIGMVSGVTGASAIFGNSLRAQLASLLSSWPNGEEIADKSASNVQYVQELSGKVHELVLSAYIFAFRHSWMFSLGCSVLCLVLGLLMKEKRLFR
ncbi:MFS general substrate transporter [Microthyrium microscopicum]|uniref:MFS general substrate transporter n=1 Tax=Microthyrium microscopicum TaxID=703497 RepID=A0A6A6TX08_9PEZI|nr:MFS general substrate transporter [Microthyrium microscopicum]